MARSASRAAEYTGTGAPDPFGHASTRVLIATALWEDVGRGDVTTAATVAPDAWGRTALVAREACVVAGLPIVPMVLEAVAGASSPPPHAARTSAARTITTANGKDLVTMPLLIQMSVQDDLNYGKLWDSIFPECYPWQDHVELIWSW